MNTPTKCPYCGSDNITKSIRISQTAEPDSIGLSYKMKFHLIGTEQIYADVCNNCGTITRFFVKNPARNWYVK